MNEVRQFDFSDEAMHGGERRKAFYRNNYDEPITEHQFVAEVTGWPKKEKHNSRTRSPSAARQAYRQLVKDYGFFPGGQDEGR